MGPQNGIVGGNFGMDLPETTQPEQDLTEEKNMARFSQSAEFKRLETYAHGRMEFYQKYLPNGKSVIDDGLSMAERGEMWVAANVVIGEFNALLGAYTNAKEVVQNARRKNT